MITRSGQWTDAFRSGIRRRAIYATAWMTMKLRLRSYNIAGPTLHEASSFIF